MLQEFESILGHSTRLVLWIAELQGEGDPLYVSLAKLKVLL